MLRCFIILCVVFYLNDTKAQDTTFVRSFYMGSTIKVPEGKKWFIERAYISANDGYNIRIGVDNFKTAYSSKDDLIIPFYCAEMELLDNNNSVFFLITIKETDL
jgi:hypothetical protein